MPARFLRAVCPTSNPAPAARRTTRATRPIRVSNPSLRAAPSKSTGPPATTALSWEKTCGPGVLFAAETNALALEGALDDASVHAQRRPGGGGGEGTCKVGDQGG